MQGFSNNVVFTVVQVSSGHNTVLAADFSAAHQRCNFGECLQIVASVSCSLLTGVLPGVWSSIFVAHLLGLTYCVFRDALLCILAVYND